MDDICLLAHTMESAAEDMVRVLEMTVMTGVDRNYLHERVDKERIKASVKTRDEIKKVLDDDEHAKAIDDMRNDVIKTTDERYLESLAILAGHFFVFLDMVREEHDAHHGVQVSGGSVSPSAN